MAIASFRVNDCQLSRNCYTRLAWSKGRPPISENRTALSGKDCRHAAHTSRPLQTIEVDASTARRRDRLALGTGEHPGGTHRALGRENLL